MREKEIETEREREREREKTHTHAHTTQACEMYNPMKALIIHQLPTVTFGPFVGCLSMSN